MDNLTHSLTGLLLSRAGFHRLSPLATPIMVVAANAPDIDVVVGLAGPLPYLEHHRGITHAIGATPLMALLAVLVVALFARRRPTWRMGLPALAGVISHWLLDWTNVYGIRLLEPFETTWHRLDITHVFDLWIWAFLLLGIAVPILSRLVSSEIGAKKSSGAGAAIFALALFGAYDFGRYLLHQRAVQTLDSRLYEGAAPRRVLAVPDPVNPLAWRGVVEGDGFVRVLPVNLARDFDPAQGVLLYHPEPSPALEKVREHPDFQSFRRFVQWPLWRIVPADKPEGAVRVTLMDLRFADPPTERFALSAIVDTSLRVIETKFDFGSLTRGPANR
ncbi:MAG: metal-dependent hydrolase [Bryobacteraceae bacterium]|nr:metal-dependent hydrolase [Bryobacteraceae bacterium]